MRTHTKPAWKWATLDWSDNPGHYMPMCRGCHMKYDRAYRAGLAV